jgi:hypothetical protein
MASGSMIYIAGFIMTGSGIQIILIIATIISKAAMLVLLMGGIYEVYH